MTPLINLILAELRAKKRDPESDAQALRAAQPNRRVTEVYEILCRVQHAQREETGGVVKAGIMPLGAALGIDPVEATRIRERARSLTDQIRRAKVGGGKLHQACGIPRRYVMENGDVVTAT